MSKEVTLEQILEVTDQIRSGVRTGSGRITGWAVQGLIEDAPKVAFDWLLKKTIEKARKASGRCGDNRERAMTDIAIASITRELSDIADARVLITGLSLYLDPLFEARFMVELASITHEQQDISVVLQAMRKRKLTGYHLVKAHVLLYKVVGDEEFLNSAYEEAKEINEIGAWMMVYNNCHKDPMLHHVVKKISNIVEKIDRAGDIAKIARVEIATMMGDRKRAVSHARALANHFDSANYFLENFAAIAAFTRDPDDLGNAFLVANAREEEDPDKGAKSWRLIIRILADVN